MDGAKHITDTLAALKYKCSSKQASILRRSVFERERGAIWNENPGGSRI